MLCDRRQAFSKIILYATDDKRFVKSFKIKLDLNPGALGIGLRVRETLEFNTPIIGLNTLWNLTDRWSFRMGANIGGANIVGSSVDDVSNTWEVVGTIAYKFELWDQSAKVFAGYRHLHVHYDDGSLDLEVDVEGPLVGMGFEF